MTDGIAQALSGRRLLLVLDNCEHVLDAAADLVETILTRTTTVKVIATSREGLRVGAEQLWPVPSLDVAAGAASAAVELFVERARGGQPRFPAGASRPRPRPSRRSAGGWTASRWRSSSRRRGWCR